MRNGASGMLAIMMTLGLVVGMVWVALQPADRTSQASFETRLETWLRSR